MHLLAALPGQVLEEEGAVDLAQSPGDIVILSAADSDLAALSAARSGLGDAFPSVRLANLLQLGHPMSVDLYVERVIEESRLVVVRLLGGTAYWSYGVEELVASCRRRGAMLALLPGDDQPDADLVERSLIPVEAGHRLWRYLTEGGVENAANALRYAASLIGHETNWDEPRPLLRAGLYWPGLSHPGLGDLAPHWLPGAPVAGIVFYRVLVQSGDVAPVDALIEALRRSGVNALPIFVSSLKEKLSSELMADLLERGGAGIVINLTGFAIGRPGAAELGSPAVATAFDGVPGPVLQAVLSGGAEEAWQEGTAGLSARDIAMNVALPEVDGRILSRAISFKAEARRDPLTECAVVAHRPRPDRVAFVAALAGSWLTLQATPWAEKKVALILANYPNRDGRMANGVGLDTPESVTTILRFLAEAGLSLSEMPETAADLMARLQAGPTNADPRRPGGVDWPVEEYRDFFETLPAGVRLAVTEQWGEPEADPFAGPDAAGKTAIRLPVLDLGGAIVSVQPARGYNIDPVATYHDPALVPPHNYFAFYGWLRRAFAAQAVVHVGKHGNLEWLPGKAVALSAECIPEAVLGPVPHLYPFIVNDPGEGTQAKRRAGAVIIDHLTPPLTRAESYGPLAELERLVDEYYDAAGQDPRRLKVLRRSIREQIGMTGLDRDCGIDPEEAEESALAKLDAYLCELKEMQIRDGLHIFGRSPEGDQATDLLVALTRLPRGKGDEGDAGITRALAADLGLGDFDPLDAEPARAWAGPRPKALAGIDQQPWRSEGDTVERLELLARALVAGDVEADPSWSHTSRVLVTLSEQLQPILAGCGAEEVAALMRGLEGRFVAPGPSGAPTRGRLDVLPTGRNFYSVDTRAVPTPAAWTLGWASAGLLVERFLQEEGEWPKAMALSAWGTANMRTGGEDIAQALALMGAKPRWDGVSGRVVGFEILPVSVMDRPRVDVTLRVSGFFRDAFPAQLALVDSAARAIQALDEPEADNPLAARYRSDQQALEAEGHDGEEAARLAGFRVFGSKPGAYGAGLQALIDEKGWSGEADLARAYLAWGGYAYGAGTEGAPASASFARRLGHVQAVVQNQDNREHDLLDSDDYYQFEGGLSVAVKHVSGHRPVMFHNDHSRPERPRIRLLREEIGRVVRARAVNPKWIAGVMRHGYKGAFEMAATVDYLFAFAATTDAVENHHFDALYDAYLDDDRVRDFIADANPAALREMAERFLEAVERGLWQPRSNSAAGRLGSLARAA